MSRCGSVRPSFSPAQTAMLLGACGGMLFLIQPAWSYADVVRFGFGRQMRLAVAPGLIPAATTVAGAAVAGLRRRAFAHHRPTVGALARTLIGWAAMHWVRRSCPAATTRCCSPRCRRRPRRG